MEFGITWKSVLAIERSSTASLVCTSLGPSLLVLLVMVMALAATVLRGVCYMWWYQMSLTCPESPE